MFIGNNFMVNVRFYDMPAHQEYFIDEKSAREYANRCYKMRNSRHIELFQRRRGGYQKVKAIVRHYEGSDCWDEK